MRTNKEKELKSQKLRRILFARGVLLQLGFPFHHGDLVSTWKPLSNRKSCFYKESKKRKSQILIQLGELVAAQIKAQSMDFLADFGVHNSREDKSKSNSEINGRLWKNQEDKIRKLRKENPIIPRRESHRFCGDLLCN